MMPYLESGEETLVGGQAVMEGVMMRAPHSYCVSVRKPDGSITSEQMPLPRISEQYRIYKYPVFRGVGTLYQAMKLGIKALRFSANAALETETAKSDAGKSKEIPAWAMAANLLFSLAFFLFMYKFLPLLVVTTLKSVYPIFEGRLLFNLADGVIRLVIFLAFLFTVSRLKDMRRVWEYHGAEHKVVFNFESGQPVTIANAQRFKTFHPRCGTSFLMLLMVVSIVVYSFIPFDGFAAKLLWRILLLPLIAGLSYEVIRFAAKHPGGLLGAITAPGLWLQRITTKPPDDDETAVAIHALEGAMALEKSQGGEMVIA
jgi:uncharacterized protein YqhQ